MTTANDRPHGFGRVLPHLGANVLSVALLGCVTSREVTVRITDRSSSAPIESARVQVEHSPVFLKFGAQSVPALQEGLTGSDGTWGARLGDGMGSIAVSAPEYGEVRIYFGLDWEWPSDLQIDLTRCGSADPRSTSPPSASARMEGKVAGGKAEEAPHGPRAE